MLSRRSFLALPAGAALAAPAKMTPKERVERALRGQDVDRTPFTFWHHFHLEKLPAERHAAATLDFHRKYRTDLVKVMSDYTYPKPSGKWYEPRVVESPFPQQLAALAQIRDGLDGHVWFLDTVFNPWSQATKLSSKTEVLGMMRDNPRDLLEALQAIAESQANHAAKAISLGAAGIFFAIDNAQDGVLTPEEYAKFSEPFDRLILDRVSGAPLNTLHLHGNKVYVERFLTGWPVAAINYSNVATGFTIAQVRRRFPGIIMAGLDEVNFRKLSEADLKQQYEAARAAAGPKFICTPGCSVPDDSTHAELARLPHIMGA